jgi:virginiamycin B lyase
MIGAKTSEGWSMAPYRFGLAAVLLSAVLGVLPAVAQDAGLNVETQFPQRGDYTSVGFESFWMMSDEKLLRIAFSDNRVTEIPIKGSGGRWRRTAVGEGAVWVADNLSQTIYKIDPATHRVAMAIPADFFTNNEKSGEIAVGEGAVWAITGPITAQVLRRYSVVSGAEQAALPLPSVSSRVMVEFGSVWIAGAGNEELYRLDPTNNQITATVELHSRPIALASSEGSVWVGQTDGRVQRIDGNSGKQLATIATQAVGATYEMAVGGGFVWISTLNVPLLKVDPQTNSQQARFDSPPGVSCCYSVAYGGGSLWLAGSSVLRIKPPL